MNKKHILLVDDEVSVTRTMKINLERTGNYVVRTENHAKQAVAAAHEFKPDLIFLDVMMPEMDGGDVAVVMRHDPLLKQVPIIFLTAIVSKQETGDEGKQIGGEKFIAKPLNMEALIQCIEENTAPERAPGR